MKISIEVPVFKGEFLQQCINSVLNQTSDAWQLSLVWDGGDSLSRQILEKVKKAGNPNIKVYFTPNQGIARARAYLSNQNKLPYILPLDDDDELAENAVEVFIETAKAMPWASLIRAKRNFIDEKSETVEKTQWFPFGPRNYYKGMVTDVFNQAQPYLINRAAYKRTRGWRGFDDFMQAGEDCDIFLQLEEIAHFELVDEVLYHYRLHGKRASDALTSAAAFEMWRRLADDALNRMKLPLSRISDTPPFQYHSNATTNKSLKDVEFVVRNNSHLIETLKQLGVDEAAIIVVPTRASNIGWKMTGFRSSSKPLICFMGDAVEIPNLKALEYFVETLNRSGVDVLTPASDDLPAEEIRTVKRSWLNSDCMLVRREVILATGGFDETFIPEGLQCVDFSIQANHRNFGCYEACGTGIQSGTAVNQEWKTEELSLLQRKWQNHKGSLTAVKELSSISGVNAC